MIATSSVAAISASSPARSGPSPQCWRPGPGRRCCWPGRPCATSSWTTTRTRACTRRSGWPCLRQLTGWVSCAGRACSPSGRSCSLWGCSRCSRPRPPGCSLRDTHATSTRWIFYVNQGVGVSAYSAYIYALCPSRPGNKGHSARSMHLLESPIFDSFMFGVLLFLPPTKFFLIMSHEIAWFLYLPYVNETSSIVIAIIDYLILFYSFFTGIPSRWWKQAGQWKPHGVHSSLRISVDFRPACFISWQWLVDFFQLNSVCW